MKYAIRMQVGVALVLVAYWAALFCGVRIPPENQAEISGAKDVLLLIFNAGTLSHLIQAANEKISEKGETS